MTPQTLRKERRRKFDEEIQSSNLHYWARRFLESEGFKPNEIEESLKTSRENLAKLLADAAESRSERKTDETKGKYNVKGIEAAMFADREVTEDDLQHEHAREKAAIDAFEKALGIPANWNWYPAKTSEAATWRQFRVELVKLYEADNKCFDKYQAWRKMPYVKGAVSNSTIQRFPQNWMTYWSDYCASSGMINKPEEKTEYHQPLQGDFVPAPEPKW